MPEFSSDINDVLSQLNFYAPEDSNGGKIEFSILFNNHLVPMYKYFTKYPRKRLVINIFGNSIFVNFRVAKYMNMGEVTCNIKG